MTKRSPLPVSLAAIANEAGEDVAVALARIFGGERIYVPKDAATLTRKHPLVAGIGIGMAQRLVAVRGGERLQIATARSYFRKREAARLLARGRSIGEIARHLGVCRRYAARLMADEARA